MSDPEIVTLDGAAAAAALDELAWVLEDCVAGVIPGYALWPDGRPCDAAIFWKRV